MPLRRIAQHAADSPLAGAEAAAFEQLRMLGFNCVLWMSGRDTWSGPLYRYADLSDADLEYAVQVSTQAGLALLVDVHPPEDTNPVTVEAWVDCLCRYAQKGVSGVRCLDIAHLDPQQWRQVRGTLHDRVPDFLMMAWMPGVDAQWLSECDGVGFDGCFSSLAWWDQRSAWLASEYERLERVAPVIATLDADTGAPALDPRWLVSNAVLVQRLWVAAYQGQSFMVSAHRAIETDFGLALSDLSRWVDSFRASRGRSMVLSGPLSPDAVLYRRVKASHGLVLHAGDSGTRSDSLIRAERILHERLPGSRVILQDGVISAATSYKHVSLIPVRRNVPVSARHIRAAVPMASTSDLIAGTDPSRPDPHLLLKQAMNADRIVIDNVTPQVNDGRFAVKLILGRMLTVQADVFADGHAPLVVRLLWRAADQSGWREVAMHPIGNDRWQGCCMPRRLGRHEYTVQAWMHPDAPQHYSVQCTIFSLQVERREAEYSSWYELFPRSMGAPGRHGHLDDVLAQLPRIRAMGFDVLYFPPIHPIGRTNRKGRNNSLTADDDDPGSPYAIGSEAGGHDAIHPELGTLDDFRRLLKHAHEHEIEIALDFAIQCSPDHPWLRKHPEWFHWRADGTVQYAENPPKRYEDIVNPDFYSTAATRSQRMALWRTLRDIVLFWIRQGVRLFRVDNPHTKPLPFWEWMIAQVQRRHPDVVFLSEAFTRPLMMHRLAKLGFSQSYTYFTWRNTKAELTAYLTEVASAGQLDYFRPHFFVNTPDINPYFLQSSGRAGFLIRAALAATTSGLWGMYSGFELCEGQPLPGKEEYLNSEKYELRTRDWSLPGNIVSEITRLNEIRRSSPALQTHRNIRFHPVSDERILFFSKTAITGDNVVLVAICLNPGDTVSTTVSLPSRAGTSGRGARQRLRSLWDGREQIVMSGELPVTLTPDQPFVLWSVLP